MSRIGRNSPCPCSSGRKFKRCCGPKVAAQWRALNQDPPPTDPVEIERRSVALLDPDGVELEVVCCSHPDFEARCDALYQRATELNYEDDLRYTVRSRCVRTFLEDSLARPCQEETWRLDPWCFVSESVARPLGRREAEQVRAAQEADGELGPGTPFPKPGVASDPSQAPVWVTIPL